ncbi:hypothetical protein [Qipengyuania qiaonensis]|uniref:Uncharacterized protein n=1 Tax=Qipengyuania qiaonensis TaxID=2867240 RepID=A0ABS7J922_9SPHN|nr:hypothetical protein [Qipengyuania qiaonensis]MBX7483820.1 hypothetical protein [Qipengyuania qiaonensis]
MKIKFGSRYSIEEFGEAMDKVLQTLKLNGADGIANVTVYLTVTKDNRKIVLTEPGDERKVIEHLEYDPPVIKRFNQVHPSVKRAEGKSTSASETKPRVRNARNYARRSQQ